MTGHPSLREPTATELVQVLAEELEHGIDSHLLAVHGHGRVAPSLELDADEGIAELGGEPLEALADRAVLAVAHAQHLLAGSAPSLTMSRSAGERFRSRERAGPIANGVLGWHSTGAATDSSTVIARADHR